MSLVIDILIPLASLFVGFGLGSQSLPVQLLGVSLLIVSNILLVWKRSSRTESE